MKSWLWLIVGVVACSISWAYMHRVILPWEHYINIEHGPLKAQMGDLYSPWVGTRELLLHGRNPYGPDVSHEIQIAFYGHPIEQSYDKPQLEIVDEQRFVYPVYVVFLLAPTVHMDFAALQWWAPIVSGGFVAATVLFWLRLAKWRLPPHTVLAIIMIVFSTPQIAQGLRLRQLGFFVIFLVAFAVWCIVHQRLLLAGALLALSTIKPQMVILCLAWFLIWTLGDWGKRWRLAAGFSATLLVLIGGGELLLPNWPRYFLAGLNAYHHYLPTTSPARLILGNWLGTGISALAIIALGGYSWSTRSVAENSAQFLEMTGLFLLSSSLFLPLVAPYSQVLLLLPVLMLVRDWRRLNWSAQAALITALSWPPIVAAILLLHRPNLNSTNRTPLLPSALLILFPFLVGCLMFVRQRGISE